MASSYGIFPIAVIISMSFNEVGCADTEVYRHGNSTNVVTQSGESGSQSTEVTRTSDGQKVVSRKGGNVNISEQGSGSSELRSRSARNHNDEGRSTESSRDCVDDDGGFFSSLRRMMWSSTKCDTPSLRGERIPTSSEYKNRMQERMRPVTP